MADDESGEVLPTFKRRKVVRKPNHEDDSNEVPSNMTSEADAPITKRVQEQEEDGAGLVKRLPKRGGAKKLGIGFSSTETARNGREEQPDEQALVVASDSGVAELPHNGRFVKPTGRVGVVTEDKHMMAYVDSKLAEIRPAATPQPTISSTGSGRYNERRIGGDAEAHGNIETSRTPAKTGQQSSGDTTYQIAQERSRRVYQRPTKRKPRPSRPETDVARDSMIDQIMGENQVPHYDQTAPQTHDENEGEDNDAAAEEAFKAQMLADLERNAKRRPPRITQATTSTGPKLGGSRAQREKMRALEEAKGSGSGGKK